MRAELEDPEAAWGVVGEARTGLGPLDVLVLNAGHCDRRAVDDMTGDAWRRTMAVHVDSPAAMAQAAAENLRRRTGNVVFVSSVAAHRGSTHGAH